MDTSPFVHSSAIFTPGFASFMTSARASAIATAQSAHHPAAGPARRYMDAEADYLLLVMSAAALYFVTTSDCSHTRRQEADGELMLCI